LQTGANNILVKAYPSDAECDIVATGIKLYYYVPLVATSCEETYVTPAQVVLGSGVFYVSCSGANVSSYDILVTDPNGTNSLVPLPAGVTGTTITPTMTGQYRFQCIANGVAQNGQQVQVDCPAIGGVVTEPSSACIDPITNLTITNYTSGQTVGNQTITLQGQVE